MFGVVCNVEVSMLRPADMPDVVACAGCFAEGGFRTLQENPVVGVAVGVCVGEGGAARAERDV